MIPELHPPAIGKGNDERQGVGLYLNVPRFCTASGLSVGTIERLLRDGRLAYVVEGRRRLIPSSELDRLPAVLGAGK